jgi:cephalosporin-C deacetylase-like acetyl esterase
MTQQPAYPTPAEIDTWCSRLLEKARGANISASLIDAPTYPSQLGVRHTHGARYVAFELADHTFYGYWQPTYNAPAPLLIHLPGYGTEMSAHPELVMAGYNMLHVNPLGYHTPQGPDLSKQKEGAWPVMPDTVRSLGEHGYVDWLLDALLAVRWAREQPQVTPDRLGFLGTSQGGGTALLMASLLSGEGVRAVAADEPYLTDFRLNAACEEQGGYPRVAEGIAQAEARNPALAQAMWQAVGAIDTVSHAHRLTMPVLLVSGGTDTTCPAPSVRSLFDRLPGTRSYTEVAGLAHGYHPAFVQLCLAWFGLYV